MEKHVNLLGILYLVWGGLAVLLAVSVLLLAGGALALLVDEEAAGVAAGFTAAVFSSVGVLLLAGGGLAAWAGSRLRRLRPSARLVVLGLGVLNLFLLPFGTALGIYSLWVLLNDGVRARFEVQG